MTDYLGKRFPKEHDTELTRLQTSVLSIVRPLSSAWQHLLEQGLEEDPTMVVPATEVLLLAQCTLCLVGNASELISQARRTRILEAIDKTWAKYGSEEFSSAHETLFGEEFQESLTKKVEKDSALSKAAFMTKKSAKQRISDRTEGQRKDQFFRGSPPAKYGGRQGKSFFPYSTPQFRRSDTPKSRNNHQGYFHRQNQGQRSLFHEPKLPHRGTQPSKPSPS